MYYPYSQRQLQKYLVIEKFFQIDPNYHSNILLSLQQIIKLFNFQKSQAIYFGLMKVKIQKPFINKGLQWPEPELKYLEVKIPLTNC